ncbi:methylmalonyl-CoA epimerase [Fonticella tunisiensis]|uniref:Methylmalonyl-CoA epimerase n=1 Tax=Fonticella tunisiensis TaxID=1096341 RepID=A0A4R7K9P0_9CLOT|nr:methylmalonyl-CoA epimerase [Fonticella tunisiensis]TDT50311.1 methylmalonyl-CoA epimerase [Fonticella tunisiensis]
MIHKIDHIGIAAESIEKSLKFYSEQLQIECEDIEYIESQKVKVAFLPLGDSEIELLEGTDDDSVIKNFISKRGQGIHHIAFRVNSLEEEIKRLKELGIVFINENPSYGAGAAKIAFLHPKSTGGVLVELCEREV